MLQNAALKLTYSHWVCFILTQHFAEFLLTLVNSGEWEKCSWWIKRKRCTFYVHEMNCSECRGDWNWRSSRKCNKMKIFFGGNCRQLQEKWHQEQGISWRSHPPKKGGAGRMWKDACWKAGWATRGGRYVWGAGGSPPNMGSLDIARDLKKIQFGGWSTVWIPGKKGWESLI